MLEQAVAAGNVDAAKHLVSLYRDGRRSGRLALVKPRPDQARALLAQFSDALPRGDLLFEDLMFAAASKKKAEYRAILDRIDELAPGADAAHRKSGCLHLCRPGSGSLVSCARQFDRTRDAHLLQPKGREGTLPWRADEQPDRRYAVIRVLGIGVRPRCCGPNIWGWTGELNLIATVGASRHAYAGK